jgi:hypothetical protein
MRLINGRIYIQINQNTLLEYLEDYNWYYKKQCIQAVHLNSHRGLKALYNEVKLIYYNIKQDDMKRILADCEICSRRRVVRTTTITTLIIILNKLDRLQADITYMVEYEEANQGYKYILNVIDCATKYAWSFPCVYRSAIEVYTHLESIFYSCSAPKELHTDKALNFVIVI